MHVMHMSIAVITLLSNIRYVQELCMYVGSRGKYLVLHRLW